MALSLMTRIFPHTASPQRLLCYLLCVSREWMRNMWLITAFSWLAFLLRGFIENPVYSTLILWAFIGFGIPITLPVLSLPAVALVRKRRDRD